MLLPMVMNDRGDFKEKFNIDHFLYEGANTDLIENNRQLDSEHLHRYTGGQTMSERAMDYADEGFSHIEEALGMTIDNFLSGNHNTKEDKKRRKLRDELNRLVADANYQARRSTGIYYTYEDRRKDFEKKIEDIKKFCKKNGIKKSIVIDSRGYTF